MLISVQFSVQTRNDLFLEKRTITPDFRPLFLLLEGGQDPRLLPASVARVDDKNDRKG